MRAGTIPWRADFRGAPNAAMGADMHAQADNEKATAFGLGNGLPSLDELRAAVAARLVSQKTLLTRSGRTYLLFNYTPRATFARAWSDVTMAARGLIVCEETGEIVAAPFKKFMNLGEPLGDGSVAGLQDGPFEAFVKLDGSLGILFRADGEVRWATRGSFTSTQSAVAQRIWDARYRQHSRLLLDDPEWERLTLLAEIIHPETRVVCRYGFEDLVLVGARDRRSGEDLAYERLVAIGERLGMPVVERVEGDLRALLERAEGLDENQEGFVLRWADGYRLKVKGAAYKWLHRVLVNMTPQRIAQEWREGRLEDVMLLMPEEFREEAEAIAAELDARLRASVREVGELYARAPRDEGQRAFARWVQQQAPRPLHGLLYGRRQLDLADEAAVAKLVRGVVVGLARSGRLAGLLGPEVAALGEGLQAGEGALAEHLWAGTRDPAALNRLRAWANGLPRKLRGPALGAIDDLLPDAVIQRARAFAARADVRAQLGELDLEALVTAAPGPDAPAEQHQAWVLAQPLVLRSFLDRWRLAGQRETAVEGARKLLAAGLAAGCLEPLLAGRSDVDTAAVAADLERLEGGLVRLWGALPRTDDPEAVEAWLAGLDAGRRAWADALVREYWGGHRDRALAQFLEAHAEDRGRAALLAEDA